GGTNQSVGLTSTGSAGYVTFQNQAYEVPADAYAEFKKSYERQQAQQPKSDTSLGALGIDPLKWIEDAKLEDDEQVGGVDTKHVSGSVDIPTFVNDLNT